MGKLKIAGVIGGNFSSFTVDGVPGHFRSTSRGSFNQTRHVVGGNWKLVCSAPDGNFGPGMAKANPSKRAQILASLESYIAKNDFPE